MPLASPLFRKAARLMDEAAFSFFSMCFGFGKKWRHAEALSFAPVT
jgi:hypothetical protein